MPGALLVAGTTSDAGKSVLAAGLCRWLARRGVRVAPFKAQNMSLNSFVTADGAEIGRAQAMQAAAAGIEPDARMNPVLLKPGSDRRTQVVVLGRAEGEVDAAEYRQHAARLLDVATDSLARLRREYDVVICEGAGSPAEINLRATDIANMGLARAARLPVIVVGDIDRGGVFAALHGTLALLEPADQALVAGFVINKFRGAPELLVPGVRMLQELTGRVADLAWLRDNSMAEVIAARAAKGLPVLGIGSYQMLGREIDDEVESGAGRVAGLGVLPVRVAFGAPKRLGRPAGSCYGADVAGYEIHHGIATLDPGAEPFLDGCRTVAAWGTSWHGTLESDAFRRAFLTEVAALTGRDFTVAPDTDFAALRQARLDTLGDLVAGHLDTAALERLIDGGPPPGLPVVWPAGSRAMS